MSAIPQSDALAEAQPDASLDELVLRFISDPLAPNFERDADAIIAAARAQAARHAEAEAAGKRPPRPKKAKAELSIGLSPDLIPKPNDEDPPPWND